MDKKQELVYNWIKKAEHDSICFHCQQCAEKMMKAYLIKKDIEFAKTHSLSYLLD